MIVDRYSEFLVCQFFTAGMDCFKPLIVESLNLLTAKGIFEKSEGEFGTKKASNRQSVCCRRAAPELIAIEENGFKFVTDLRRGQKTGFGPERQPSFLDHREGQEDSQLLLLRGAFSVYALGGGAKESSRWILRGRRSNWPSETWH